jgi:hypothetical protein
MMPARPFLFAAVLWPLTASCGGGSESIPVEDFPARFATEWCGLLERCCLGSGGTGQGSCEADITTSVTTDASEAAADGATWDAATAGRCIDALRDADCASVDAPALRELLDTCDDSWKGVIPPGGVCQSYLACAELDVTGGELSGRVCANSVCVPVVLAPPGASCPAGDTTRACDPYLASCESDTCVALPGAGESCSNSCRTGARCTDGMCVALLAMGEACSSDVECLSDTCGGGRCASTLVLDGDYCALP